jgi:rubrerythrin
MPTSAVRTRFELKHEKDPDIPGRLPGLEELLRRPGSGNRRIRCPHCAWQPERHSLWRCQCGHMWNTFDTRGVCPACQYVWRNTQCLRCQAWALHEDWYEGPQRAV